MRIFAANFLFHNIPLEKKNRNFFVALNENGKVVIG